MSAQTRQPAGTPTGGQFSTSVRTEANVALTPPGPPAQVRDELAMDRIALRLGAVDEWDIGDVAQAVAAELTATGRPGTGDGAPDEFTAEFEAYRAARTGPVTDTTRQLDAMALTLGTSPDWDADIADTLAQSVALAGRPVPGDVDPADYIAQIASARAYRAPSFEQAQSEIADGLHTFVERMAYLGAIDVNPAGFTAHVEREDDGSLSYSRTLTVRGPGDEDEGLDVTGTAGERLLNDLAAFSPWVGRLGEVTR